MLVIKGFQFLQAVFLQGDIVVVVEVVDAHDGAALHVVEETLDEVGTDEAGRAGDEDVHIDVE